MSTAGSPLLAFIYDRCHTQSEVFLDLRLAECRAYAVAENFEIAGQWIDRGTAAILNGWRPHFTALLDTMRLHADRDTLLLVHGWDRLSRDEDFRASMRARIEPAGGRCISVTEGTGQDALAGRGVVAP